MFIAKTDIGVTRPSRYITANVIPNPIAPMAMGAATETTVLKMSSRTSATTGKVMISARLRSRPVYSLMSEKIAEPPVTQTSSSTSGIESRIFGTSSSTSSNGMSNPAMAKVVRPSGETRFVLPVAEEAVDPGYTRITAHCGENGLGLCFIDEVLYGEAIVGQDQDDYGLVEDAFLFEDLESLPSLGILIPKPRRKHGTYSWGQHPDSGKHNHPKRNDQPAVSVCPTRPIGKRRKYGYRGPGLHLRGLRIQIITMAPSLDPNRSSGKGINGGLPHALEFKHVIQARD